MSSCYNSFGKCISSEVIVPASFFQRAKGLLGKKKLLDNESMLFYNCNSVHMFAMKFSLDVIYLDKKFKVVKLVDSLKPWHCSFSAKAKHTLELPLGAITKFNVQLGEQFLIKDDGK